MRALRPGWAFRAGRRSRRLAGDGPRGDGSGKTGGGVRALAVTRSAAATVAVAVLERRNARIAPWLGVPRGAAVATVASAQPESCLTLRGRIPLHCAARGRGKME